MNTVAMCVLVLPTVRASSSNSLLRLAGNLKEMGVFESSTWLNNDFSITSLMMSMSKPSVAVAILDAQDHAALTVIIHTNRQAAIRQVKYKMYFTWRGFSHDPSHFPWQPGPKDIKAALSAINHSQRRSGAGA
ncbi:hypothetical protein D3C80_1194470 [compost metagenome]